MQICRDVIKTRELQFLSKLPGIDEAEKARRLLSGVKGIEHVEQTHPGRLSLRYDVRQLTLQMIESALRDVGFFLDNSLVTRIRRSLFAYCEEAQRASLGLEQDSEHVMLSHHDSATHDPRPHNWRNYL
ncbi:MAG: hypothetical protein WBN96_11170 [Gammaproteobacteria bacterium]